MVSALVNAQLAQRSVEDEIKRNALEAGQDFKAKLHKSSSYDQGTLKSLLDEFVRTHREVSAIELAVEHKPEPDQILRATLGPNGPSIERLEGDAQVPGQVETQVVDGPDGRMLVVTLPTKASTREQTGKTYSGSNARITVEAPLAEADALAASERRSSWLVTLGGAVLLVLAAQLLLSRFIGRPIDQIVEVMSQAESGRLDVQAPTGAGPEFDLVSRVFNTMIARINQFDQLKTEQIAEATADLNRKNRDLVELNDLLVAARRDLTAKERLAALGQLAGTIAHELGNPLNSISGHVQLLERNPNLSAEAKDDLKMVSSEVKRMTDVIRRFLDSTRGLRPAPEQVELATLVTESLDMSLSADARARLTVSRQLAHDLGGIVTDPSLVRHVLTNLIANAVDAMPGGGKLTVSAGADGSELKLSVRDTGTGISPDDRRRIFEPFYTTKARGKGTGLGLAICREIALALKGRIDVETEPGQGSTFTLAIPLQRPGLQSLQVAEAAT